MTASSVTGTGVGEAGKPSAGELAILAGAPTIIFAGIAEAVSLSSSPPSTPHSNTVTFPYPLVGGPDNYVIMLTSINAGVVYVSDRDEDDDGNFVSFSFVSESDGDIMYLVSKVGYKPNI